MLFRFCFECRHHVLEVDYFFVLCLLRAFVVEAHLLHLRVPRRNVGRRRSYVLTRQLAVVVLLHDFGVIRRIHRLAGLLLLIHRPLLALKEQLMLTIFEPLLQISLILVADIESRALVAHLALLGGHFREVLLLLCLDLAAEVPKVLRMG